MADIPSFKINTSHRLWDWPAIGLLFLVTLTASRRLIITDWTDHLIMVQTITFFGTLLGIFLGLSLFSGRRSIRLSAAYGIILTFWQMGLTMDTSISWLERLQSLLGRLLYTIDQLFSGQAVTDPIFFRFLMIVLFWIIANTAGYLLVRKSAPWSTVLPAGVGILILQIYDPFHRFRIWYMAFYLIIAILLVARVFYVKQFEQWKKQKTHIPMYIGVDLIRTSAITLALLIMFAWLMPSAAGGYNPAADIWEQISQPWYQIREEISRAFSALQPNVSRSSDFYGSSMPLGRGNPLAEDIVFEIETPGRPSPNIRFYWHARSYDYFHPFENGWETTTTDFQFVTPDLFDIEFPIYDNHWEATISLTSNISLNTLYTAPQAVWISRPANLYLDFDDDNLPTINYIQAEDRLMAGETYQFTALVTNASIIDLQNAGSSYPNWITERYLQLPDTITDRTIELAQQIAGDLDNPYDIAEAVTNFLRANIEYSDTIPSVPGNQDPVDWILFDLNQGFCNYYATSEVMLLRILGIPARLGVGFAQGERTLGVELVEATPEDNLGGFDITDVEDFIYETEYFSVRQLDLHSWPEVYFPNIGWVEFEPTGNQLPIIRPTGIEIFPQEERQEDIAEEVNLEEFLANLEEEQLEEIALNNDIDIEQEIPWYFQSWFSYSMIIIGVGLVALVFGRRTWQTRGIEPVPVLIVNGLKKRDINPPHFLIKWASYARLLPIEKAYQEINNALHRLGESPNIDHTPSERAELLVAIMPSLEEPITRLKEEYHVSKFSPLEGDSQSAWQAGRSIRKESYFAWFRKLFSRIQEDHKDQRLDLTEIDFDN